MDSRRFDDLTRALAAPRSRRGFLGTIAGAVAAVFTGTEASAAPKAGKPSKCYGAGSHCTNAKQCCSGTCTNRQCAPEVAPQCVTNLDCDAGEVCQSGVCVPDVTGAECTYDINCEPCEVCTGGSCTPLPERSPCAGGTCIAGVCEDFACGNNLCESWWGEDEFTCPQDCPACEPGRINCNGIASDGCECPIDQGGVCQSGRCCITGAAEVPGIPCCGFSLDGFCF